MDSKNIQHLSFNRYFRRFGAEIEINSMDGRNKPSHDGELPNGSQYIGNVIASLVPAVTSNAEFMPKGQVELSKWGHTHHNNIWVVKPDSSCGMEVCSPVLKGTHGINEICTVVDGFAMDSYISADERCSLHLHIEVADLTTEQLAAVLAWWIKCEWVFYHSVPQQRKRNRYCQFIGLTDMFQHNSNCTASQLISKLSNYKYLSINTYHYAKGKRHTIEFRVAENLACMDSTFVRNWIMLLVHFVETAKDKDMPGPYEKDNPWSSWLWLDSIDVFKFLGFYPGEQYLSVEMEVVRNWFLSRLLENINSTLPGIWAECIVEKSRNEAIELSQKLWS